MSLTSLADCVLYTMKSLAKSGLTGADAIAASVDNTTDQYIRSFRLKEILKDARVKSNPTMSEVQNFAVELLIARGEDVPPRSNKLNGAWLHHIPTPAYLKWLGSYPNRQVTGTLYIAPKWARPGTRANGFVSSGNFSQSGVFPVYTDDLNDVYPINFNIIGKSIRVVTRVVIVPPEQPKDIHFTPGGAPPQLGEDVMNAMIAKFTACGYTFLHRSHKHFTQAEILEQSTIEFAEGHKETGLSSDRCGIMCGKLMVKEKGMRARDASMLKLVKSCNMRKGDIAIIPKEFLSRSDNKIYTFHGWKICMSPDPKVTVFLTSPMNRSREWIDTIPLKKIEDLKKFVNMNGG